MGHMGATTKSPNVSPREMLNQVDSVGPFLHLQLFCLGDTRLHTLACAVAPSKVLSKKVVCWVPAVAPLTVLSRKVVCWVPAVAPLTVLSRKVVCWVPAVAPLTVLSRKVVCWVPAVSPLTVLSRKMVSLV